MAALALAALPSCDRSYRDVAPATEGLPVVAELIPGSFVVQEGALKAIGSQGGPFRSFGSSFRVQNRGPIPVDWTVSSDQRWVLLGVAGGTLHPSQGVTVNVTLSMAAAQLPAGEYRAEISFMEGRGSVSREATLVISPPSSVPMQTATRVQGVAPLAVVFDSVGVATGVAQPSGVDPDYNSSSYRWGYGDPNGGVWQHNGKSKNCSVGYVGAHVYETPGTYRATLRSIDDQGTQTEYHQDIIVSDPDTVFATKTFHVAANGNDSSPGTVSQPFATVARGVQAAFVTNSTARLLLRRGDVFSSGPISLGSAAGPFLLGAYGQGGVPRVEFPQQQVGVRASQSQDVRVMDLDFVSTSTTQDPWAAGVRVSHQTSVLRCSFSNFGTAVSSNYGSEVAIVDCELLNSTEYGMYAFGPDDNSAVHLAIMGNSFQIAGQHLLRTYISRSVIHANHFGDAGGGFTALKLVGRDAATPSQFVCITDNYLTTDTTDVMTLGPENAQSDQHLRFFLIEGNHWFSQGAGNHALMIRGARVVVRNNIFDLATRRGIQVDRWGIGPIPDRVRIESNTAYSSTSGPFRLLGNVDTSDLTVVRNNIIVAPNGSVGGLTGTIVQSNNLTANAMMVSPATGDFTLRPGSPAIDAGVGESVVVDFAGSPRPVGSGVDIGAFERQ